MSNLVMHPIFSLTGADSTALTMLGVIVHPVTEPGVYRGTIVAASGGERDFTLVVDASDLAQSVAIDLAAPPVAESGGCGCPGTGGATYRTGTGHVVFHVGSGVDRYYVRLGRAGAPAHDVFDSRTLRDGDRFAARLLRPGRYRVTELEHRHAATITVGRLGSRDRSRLREPVRVSLGARGFSDRDLEVISLQGLLIEVGANAAIRIEPERFEDDDDSR
ncbi:MAG: hypothetical protein M3N49_06790 [Candidatus Eremiobacteraeota bacterium]|nr:hypothetical protein [Candidatus Eremiobacteraeota bacterium]